MIAMYGNLLFSPTAYAISLMVGLIAIVGIYIPDSGRVRMVATVVFCWTILYVCAALFTVKP